MIYVKKLRKIIEIVRDRWVSPHLRELGGFDALRGHTQHMAKRRGNPNWGKPEPIGPVVPTITSFEQVVKEFKLTPDQY